MKNVRVSQKSRKSSGAGGILMVFLIAALCIGGTYFTTANIYKKQLQNPTEEVEKKTVLVASEDITHGSYIKNEAQGIALYMPKEYPVDQVPEDAITSAAELDKLVTKINVKANTMITSNMLVGVDMDEDLSDTSRQFGINYVTLNSRVQPGDYVDIMLKSYSTEGLGGYADKVVLAKKKVLDVKGNTIYMNLDREEWLRLGIASVDASAKVSKDQKDRKKVLYAVTLASASQPKAVETYENASLASLVNSDENLIAEAQAALIEQQSQQVEPDSNIETVN